MDNSVEELKKDLAEIVSFEEKAERPKVKDLLSLEARRLTEKLNKLVNQVKTGPSNSASSNKCYEVKLTNYAWDQSDKFVKFYVTLPNLQTLSLDNISCIFNPRSIELHVNNLDNKNYTLHINNLLHPISTENSNWKVKKDMIIVNAAKLDSKKWEFVTETEKNLSNAKKLPSMDTDEPLDPSEQLMSIMKKTYEQGDDEMKRTIAKSWYESMNKKSSF